MEKAIDVAAREVFETDADPICDRDRRQYRNWDGVPDGLRQWYRDRVAAKPAWLKCNYA